MAVVLIIAGVFTLTVSFAEKKPITNPTILFLEPTDAILFENGQPVETATGEAVVKKVNAMELAYEENKATLSLDLDGTEQSMDVTVDLYPSQLHMFGNEKLIGSEVDLDSAYELTFFRIENPTTSWTLLSSNLHLEGKPSLAAGIKDAHTNKMYYVQQAIPDTAFQVLFQAAEQQLSLSTLTLEELKQLEWSYLFLGNDQLPSGEVEIEVHADGEM